MGRSKMSAKVLWRGGGLGGGPSHLDNISILQTADPSVCNSATHRDEPLLEEQEEDVGGYGDEDPKARDAQVAAVEAGERKPIRSG